MSRSGRDIEPWDTDRPKQQARDAEPLPHRLRTAILRVYQLTKDGIPLRLSIPPHWQDDDIYLLAALEDALQFVEGHQQMKEPNLQKISTEFNECQTLDALTACFERNIEKWNQHLSAIGMIIQLYQAGLDRLALQFQTESSSPRGVVISGNTTRQEPSSD